MNWKEKISWKGILVDRNNLTVDILIIWAFNTMIMVPVIEKIYTSYCMLFTIHGVLIPHVAFLPENYLWYHTCCSIIYLNCSWVIPELAVSMILQLSWLGWLVSAKIKHHQRTPKEVTQQIIWETHYLACQFHLHYFHKVKQTVTVMLVQESLWNNLDHK